MKLTIDLERHSLEDEPMYIASIKEMPGMVESGTTEEEAFNELMISLRVKIMSDSGLSF